VQQFGKYNRIANPGLNIVCWPFQSVTPVSTKVNQVDVKTSTKTKDNVTVVITTAVQFAVDPMKVEDFFFKLAEPARQISAHVENVVRSQIPKMDLDTAFLAKDDLAMAVKDDLSKSMAPYGLYIHGCLMTEMLPDSSVLRAMNEINAARRQREANVEKAEAEKVLAVKRAEAEAEAKHLSGIGTAKMRQAITDGFRGSIHSMQESCGLEAKEVVHMMLVTQYLDVLKDFAVTGKSSILVPHGPSAVGDLEAQVQTKICFCRYLFFAPSHMFDAIATLRHSRI
jgi:regulator of protease activity HflC (stomatin/prohibitin superfamily)